MTEEPLVLALNDGRVSLELAGGKGSSLARLAMAGLPVPPGLHVTTAAYRSFVAAHGLLEGIVEIASTATPDLPDMSFAGQQDTYLNIRGPEEVLDAVKRCWGSLWTARASAASRPCWAPAPRPSG